MAESARDRIAFYLWCIKHDCPEKMRTGDNVLLAQMQPKPADDEEEFKRTFVPPKEKELFYNTTDLIFEMMRYDIFKLVAGGEETVEGGLMFGGWAEGIQDALEVLGWKNPNNPDPEGK